ncbi:MAG: cache domain-containing protein [Thermodesulfobacteriota bacterium]
MNKKRKLLPAISMLLIAGFVMTSLASYFASRASLRSQITRNTLPLTSDNLYSEIQRDLLRPIFISSLMASDTFLRDWVIQGEQDVAQITRYLGEIKDRFGTVTSFFVSERTRNYYHAEGILKTVSATEERDVWYFRVRDMKTEYEINMDPDLANKDAMTIFINYRVFDFDGKYIGATGVGLTVNAVKRLIEKYQRKYQRNIYFIDQTGAIKMAGSQFPATTHHISQVEGLAPLLERIVSGKETYFRYQNQGRMIHLNTRYIEEFGLYLLVEQAEEKALRTILTTLLINLAVCAVITVVILVLTSLTINAYQKRIETLRGIVPICSFCKQIRDDKGYWNQVEEYVSKYTDAEFSHGVCPECKKKHYPELFGKKSGD